MYRPALDERRAWPCARRKPRPAAERRPALEHRRRHRTRRWSAQRSVARANILTPRREGAKG